MKKKVINCLAIVFSAILVYGVTIFFDYTYFDDQSLILENKEVLSSFSNIGELFTEDVFFSSDNFYYRPLLNLSFMFDANVGSFSPWVFHFSNIIIHALATSLLFLLLLELGASFVRSRFLSFLFLFHPALVSAVAWIPGRNDSMLTVFILASFIFFIKFIKDRKISYFSLSSLFYTLALFTKETAVFLPFFFILYYLILSNKKIKKKEASLFIFSIVTASFLWFLFRSVAIDYSPINLGEIVINFLQFSPLFIISFAKFFLPFNLAPISLLFDSNIIFGLISITFIIFLLFKKRISKKYLSFGLLWFILFLSPALLNPDPKMSYQLMMLEHRLYLPFIGIILMFIGVEIKNTKERRLIKFLALGVLLIFSAMLFSKIPHYRNPVAFWSYALSKTSNSPLASRNLGAMYHLQEDYDMASYYYKKSLELNPKEPMAHYNLALIYLEEDDLEKAEAEFRLELDINPTYLNAIKGLDNLHNLKKKLR